MGWRGSSAEIRTRGIDAFAIEVDDAIVGRDVDVDVGKSLTEMREARDQPERSERLIGRYGQRLRRLIPADRSNRLRDLVEHALRRCMQHLPRIGQQELAMASLEKRQPELLLERLHLP